MTEENEVYDDPATEDVQHDEVQDQPRTVPLEAYEAERRKRQEVEAEKRALENVIANQHKPQDDLEDDSDFMTKADIKRLTFEQKREVLEEAYLESKPENVEVINKHLEAIIKRKPWLAPTIEAAPNRYARAYEIVQDYMPKEEKSASSSKFSRPQDDAKRIVENAQKPGNPATIAKASQGSQQDYLKSIRGTSEFREYRKKMLAGG